MDDDQYPRRAGTALAGSLSAKLLALTVAFVMLAELLIYLPSLANFRVSWLEDRIAAGNLAMLVLDATAEDRVSTAMKDDLLRQAGAHAIALRRPDRRLLLYTAPPPDIDINVDLAAETFPDQIRAAIAALVRPGDRVLRVLGPAPGDPLLTIEMVFDQVNLRRALITYSRNILLLALVISAITAALLFLSLQWIMVRPMRRIAEGVVDFSRDPEHNLAGVQPSARRDEIGVIQSALVAMQLDLRAALLQRRHLAALGSAVVKINHDLRGILSTAVLVSERLVRVEDPEVKRIVPPLMQSIDRAINLCTQTLNFARDEGPQLQFGRFRLAELVEEVAADLVAFGEGAGSVSNTVAAELVVEADRDQLYRVFANLARNAFQAGARKTAISADLEGDTLAITVADDGPGLTRVAVEHLFEPFAGSARAGGTGLGLVIARDVMRAHGGDIELAMSDDTGTAFHLSLPVAGVTAPHPVPASVA